MGANASRVSGISSWAVAAPGDAGACWITGSAVVHGRAELSELFASAMNGLLPTLTVQDLLVIPDRAACQFIERLTIRGEEQVCFIAGFYEFRDGRIAIAKIYREGNAEVA